MRISEILTEEKRRLDPKCWDGKKIGNPKTKLKGGVRVNNCVPESLEDNTVDVEALFDAFEQYVDEAGLSEDVYDSYTDQQIVSEAAAWRKKSGKNKNGGLNAKGVASYRKRKSR